MTSTTCARPASHRGTSYWLSTPSGPETGTRVEMPFDRSPYADQSGAAIGDGRNNLVVSTFGSIGGRGTVWLVPDMRSPTADGRRRAGVDPRHPGCPWQRHQGVAIGPNPRSPAVRRPVPGHRWGRPHGCHCCFVRGLSAAPAPGGRDVGTAGHSERHGVPAALGGRPTVLRLPARRTLVGRSIAPDLSVRWGCGGCG